VKKVRESADARVDRFHPEIAQGFTARDSADMPVWTNISDITVDPLKLPLLSQPEALRAPLLPFQLEGVTWMCYQVYLL
jgi:hypothetical protein